MPRLSLLSFALLSTLAACAESDGSVEDVEAIGAAKVEVCHMNNGVGEYTIIDVAESSVDAHLAHGDALYSDELSCVCAAHDSCYEGLTTYEGPGGECLEHDGYDEDCLSNFVQTYGVDAAVTCNPGFAATCGPFSCPCEAFPLPN